MDGGWTGAGLGGMTAEDAFALGDLRIGAVLGRGATGEVRRAVTPNGELVAVKLLRQELADDSQVVARLLRECSVVARLADRHVIRIRHLIAQDDRVGIVMDYLPDGDLRGLLRRRGTLTPTDAGRLTGQVLVALRRAHEAGVVHRDVKPENVLLDGDDAVLTDFGIARQLEGPSLTTGTGILGTPSYLAPELASAQPTTPAVDIYSTGCLFYELLAGQPPFVGGPAIAVLLRHVNETPVRPADLSDQLWDLLAAMLAKQPGDRPTASQAIATLAALEPTFSGLPALPRLGRPDSATSGPRTHESVPTWSLSPDWDRNLTTQVPAGLDDDGAQPTLLNRFLADDAVAETRTDLPASRRPDARVGEPSAAGQHPGSGLGSAPPPDRVLPPGAAGRRRPDRSRRGLMLLVAAVVVLLLAGTGIAVALRSSGHGSPASDTGADTGPTSGLTPEPSVTAPGDRSSNPGPGPSASARPTSSPTQSATATVSPSAGAPAQPVLRATAQSGAVSLTITQPDGGSVTSYQIAATGLATRTVAAERTTVAVKVPDCASRSFTVTAVGPGGSTPSAPVNAVGCVAPGQVRNVVQTTPGPGSRRLTWDPPADLGGDSEIDYRIAVTGNGTATTVTTSTSPTFLLNCATTAEGADCAAGVTVYIEGRNSIGAGPKVRVPIESANASATPPAGG
jgi:serine/threonine-protein kinase